MSKQSNKLSEVVNLFEDQIKTAQTVGNSLLEAIKLGEVPEQIIKLKSKFDKLLEDIPKEVKLKDMRILAILSKISDTLVFYKNHWFENGKKLSQLWSSKK